MTRNLLSFLLVAIATTAYAQNFDATKIDSWLQEEITKNPTTDIPVYILLADRLDVQTMDQRFYERRASQLERIQELVPALQQKASRTQAPLLAWMTAQPGIDQSSVTGFWVTNVITAEAKGEAIAALSRRAEVEWIGAQGEVVAESFTRTNAPPAYAPDGIEPGLAVIKAPQMWQMGYTGYGRKAMIIDSGVDFAHPSLHVQFWGNNVGIDRAWLDADGREPQDCGSHGSHVCGTVMGLNRFENDTTGVAFNAHWLSSPIFSGGCGNGFNYVIQSFQWAINPDNNINTTNDMPDVINNSWRWDEPDGNQCNGIFKSTFDAVEAAGIAIVFSAGNSGSELSTITSPKNINTTLVNSFATGSLNGNEAELPIANSSSRGPSICGGDSSLLIKPEVSAPGVSVRSSVPNNGYDFFSGTSMAAPHVSGSVCLLKEAFPGLTGSEIKLALYFSARDLGDPGEDNVFGMGVIDVPAAYQYLIDQGHTPELTPRINDAMLIGLEINEERICGDKGIRPVITVENGGTDTLYSFEVVFAEDIISQEIYSYIWTGALATTERATIEIPIASLVPGDYKLLVRLRSPNAQPDDRPLNNQLFNRMEVFATTPILGHIVGFDPQQSCKQAAAVLTTDYAGPGEVQWFNSLSTNPTSFLASGSHFQTPPLDSTTTYYVDVLESVNIGKEEWSSEAGDYTNEISAGLVFDSYSPFLLKSVKIYTQELGSRFITLRDLDGNLYGEKIASVTDTGAVRIPLNFKVPERQDLVLLLSFGKPLGYSTADVQYPYTVTDVARIKRTESDFPSPNRYYYFYDWEAEYYNACGRTAITVEVSDSVAVPEAAFEIVTDSLSWIQSQDIAFGDQSSGGVAWHWDFGDGQNSTDQSPTHVYSDTGAFVVTLVIESQDGCTDAVFQTIHIAPMPVNVLEWTDLSHRIKIYPNPAREEVFVDFELAEHSTARIALLDVLGHRLIQTPLKPIGKERWALSVAELEAGLYYLAIDLDGRQLVKKLVIAP